LFSGIGLSGGQRARVALARALYSRAGILIVDDPLAALDHATAKGIVEKCFSGQSRLLKERTVVLATHRVSLVQRVAVQCVQILNGNAIVSSTESLNQYPVLQDMEAESPQTRRSEGPKTGQDIAPQQFMEDEKRQHGGIKAKVFWIFFKAGRLWWAFLLSMLILSRVFGIAEQWFFKAWGESYGETTSSEDPRFHGQAKASVANGDINQHLSLRTKFQLPDPTKNLAIWIGILLFVSLGRSFSSGLYALSQVTAIRATTRNMFIQVMNRISNATFRYYDVTPTGRIMNRITSDIDMLNIALDYFGSTVYSASFFGFSILAIAAVSPVFFCFAVICMIVFTMVFMQYLPASRSLKRMEASSLSPLYGLFGELLSDHGAGLLTVRAFHVQEAFCSRTVAILDEYQAYGHFSSSLQIWLTYRYDMISAFSTLFLTGTALATDLSPGLTAFLLLNTTNLINSTHMLCSRFGGLQAEFVSVERVVELLDIEEEPVGAIHPPAAWPQIGSTIIFDNVTIRYAANLDPSLRNVSLTIPGGRQVSTDHITKPRADYSIEPQQLLAALEVANPHLLLQSLTLLGLSPVARSPSTMSR
jgi:ABC-type multidrug transport system fused ATPase/permease subunit